MQAIPDRLKLHHSEDAAPDNKFYATPFLVSIFFGPIGLLFASGEKRGSFGSALMGWALGTGILMLSIGIVFGGFKGYAAYKAHQAEKMANHEQYIDVVKTIEQSRRTINEIVSGKVYEEFDKSAITQMLGSKFAEEEPDVPVRVISIDSSLKKIKAAREMANVEIRRLKEKIASLAMAGEKCAYDAQQRQRKKLAVKLISDLNLDLSSRVYIHTYLKKYVTSISATRLFFKLRDARESGDYLGFLTLARGNEEAFREYPSEDEIEQIVNHVSSEQEFSVTVKFSEIDPDCEGLRFVAIGGMDGMPLVEMARARSESITANFKLEEPPVIYLIEDGAFGFMSRVLIKEKKGGARPAVIMAALLDLENSHDEVAKERKRSRKERAEKIAEEREAQRRQHDAELVAEAERERKREREEAARQARENYERALENVRRRNREWNERMDKLSAADARRRSNAKASRDAELGARGMKSFHKSPSVR